MKITKDTPGLHIRFIREEEDLDPADCFELHEHIDWVREQIARGNEWAWFCAHVQATFFGLTADTYLGGCSYKSEEEFRRDPYYTDMVDEAIALLNERLDELRPFFASEVKNESAPAPPAPQYRCSRCGGTNIQHAMWVRLNTGEVLEEFGTFNYGDNSWCEDCEEHGTIEESEEEDDEEA